MSTDRTRGRRGRPPLDVFEIEAAKTAILAAAAAVYNRSGTEAPVQEILEEAKVSRATFYKFFPSKAALQEALLEFGMEVMFYAIEGAVTQAEDPIERIDAAVSTFLSFHAMQPGVYRILLAASLQPDTPSYRIRERAIERYAAFFADEVARAGRAPVEPLIYQGLVAAVEGVSIHLLRTGGLVEPGVLERARVALVRLIAATLGEEDDAVPPLPRPEGGPS